MTQQLKFFFLNWENKIPIFKPSCDCLHIQATMKKWEMTRISSLVGIWKVCHLGPRCSFVWIFWCSIYAWRKFGHWNVRRSFCSIVRPYALILLVLTVYACFQCSTPLCLYASTLLPLYLSTPTPLHLNTSTPQCLYTCACSKLCACTV